MKIKKQPVIPCGPYSGKPLSEASDFWLEKLAEWRWVKGTLRAAVEYELAARRAKQGAP